jgi:hypothetical protein
MIRQINEELPDAAQVTDYEVESNAAFRSIVEHIKSGQPETCPACHRTEEIPNGLRG